MAKSTKSGALLHPQFFQTLAYGFHTHLTIPSDFFSKYIEEGILDKTAKLKSDRSEITWEVNMSGRRFSDGWEKFAVAHDLQIGDVLLVRYEGNMVFNVSDLGPNFCEIQDIPPLSNDIDGQDNIGKKSLYPRTQVESSPTCKKSLNPRIDSSPTCMLSCEIRDIQLPRNGNDGHDNIGKKRMNPITREDSSLNDDSDESNMEVPIKKKAKMNGPEAEPVSISSSCNSSFVAVVTSSSLRTDTLYLPHYFPSNCRKLVLTDGGERSWPMDLSFNNSSENLYISHGWRNFCEENGKKEGGFFMFKLLRNGEKSVLSFCPTKSVNDSKQRDGLGASGRDSLSTKLSSEEENLEKESSEDESSATASLMEMEKKTKYCPRRSQYSSYFPCHKRFITFKLPPDYLRVHKLCLPVPFVRENGINKPGKIYLLGKDGLKWLTNLNIDKKGTMSLGNSYKNFVKDNCLGPCFTLKVVWEDTTPALSLCCAESTTDREEEEYFKAFEKQSLFNKDEISKDDNNKEERKMNYPRQRDSTPTGQKQFVTLTIHPSSFSACLLRLPRKFTMENDISEPGMITLLGKDGIKQQTKLIFVTGNRGTMALGKGWKDFAKANGLKTGDSFRLKLIWEDTTPVLSLCPVECNIEREEEGGGCSETDQEKSPPMEPRSSKKIGKGDENKEEYSKYESSEESLSTEKERSHTRGMCLNPSSRKEFVTLTIQPSSFHSCKLFFPKAFAIENNINKHGMITLLGKDGLKNQANLVYDKVKRTMALGKGWKDFAKANGLKTGDSFRLKLIWEDTTPVLSLCPVECNIEREEEGGGCSETDQEKSPPMEPRSSKKIGKGDENKEEYSKYESSEESLSTEKERSHTRGMCLNPSSRKEFVTLTIQPSSFHSCKLFFPKAFAIENNINKHGMITLLGKDGLKNQANLVYDKVKRTMALGKGWKDFAKANGLKTGDSFRLKLIWEDTTPVLSLCPVECNIEREEEGGGCSETDQEKSPPMEPRSSKKIGKGDENKEEYSKYESSEESLSTEKERSHTRGMCLNPSSRKEFVTLTIQPSSFHSCKLFFPKAFAIENNINKHGMITLLGKDGLKNQANLVYDKVKRTMALGKGWKDFAKANGLKTGDSFRLKLIWEDTTAVLSLCPVECNIEREEEGGGCSETDQEKSPPMEPRSSKKIGKGDENKEEYSKYESSEESLSTEKERSHTRGMCLNPSSRKEFVTLTIQPSSFHSCKLFFPKAFAIENNINKHVITLLGKDGLKNQANLVYDKVKRTMALGKGWKDFAKANGLKMGDSFRLKLIWEGTTPILGLCPKEYTKESQKKFVTLTIKPSSFTHYRLSLPLQFLKENSMIKPGTIYLAGKDGTKWLADLQQDKTTGRMTLRKGWKDFVEANNLKLGESFTMELMWKNTTPILSLVHTDSTTEIESVSREPRSRNLSSANQHRFVTLALTDEEVKACILNLPSEFLKANGINKLGKMTIFGENGTEWSAYLLTKNGFVALGDGWYEFCEANGVKLGESFTLESIYEQDSITHAFKFCPL